jgi:formylmethanofuran dehydrogenase subunit E
MSYLFEKVSYLRGMADGMNIDETKNEGKLLVAIIDALEDFAEVIEEIDEEISELDEVITDIDEDLTTLEEDFYDEEIHIEEFECPECGEPIYLDDVMLMSDEVTCPSCGKELEIEDDFEDCGCDCNCEGEEE